MALICLDLITIARMRCNFRLRAFAVNSMRFSNDVRLLISNAVNYSNGIHCTNSICSVQKTPLKEIWMMNVGKTSENDVGCDFYLRNSYKQEAKKIV